MIALLVYEQKKLNRIKKEFKEASLFTELKDFGFFPSTSSTMEKDNMEYLSKKDENDEFEYHCTFYYIKGYINFEIILELKRRVIDKNKGFLYDFQFYRRYKEKNLSLAGNYFTKFYKIKKVADLPRPNEIMRDFDEMIKILKKENIQTLNKFEA